MVKKWKFRGGKEGGVGGLHEILCVLGYEFFMEIHNCKFCSNTWFGEMVG